MNIIKYVLTALFCMCNTGIASSFQNSPIDTVTFSFLAVKKDDNCNTDLWQQAENMVSGFNLLVKNQQSLDNALLDEGLKIGQFIHNLATQDISIDTWTLINLDPTSDDTNIQGRPYLYVQLIIDRKNVNDQTWDEIQERTKLLVDYCYATEGNSKGYLEYFCDRIKEMFELAWQKK